MRGYLKTKCSFTLIAFVILGMFAISAPAQTAFAATTIKIEHPYWSGYGVSGSQFPNPSDPKKVLYRDVKGSWQMPEATCDVGEHSKAVFWVGLGGANTELEQIGALIECDDSVLQYSAVYEMIHEGVGTAVFLQDINANYIVHSNDQMSAEVHYLGGGLYKLAITDVGHWSFVSKKLPGGKTANAHDAALWIAEAPSIGTQVVQLANFTTVNFSGCTANGKPISKGPTINQFWMMPDSNTIRAAPSALDSTGTAFKIDKPQT